MGMEITLKKQYEGVTRFAGGAAALAQWAENHNPTLHARIVATGADGLQ
jgi:hypothetical protein